MIFYYLIVAPAWLLFHIVFRVRTYGRENLIHGKGFVLAPNHISALDPVFVIIGRFWGRRMLIFTKQELMSGNPLLAWFLRCMGGLAVRGTKDEKASVDAAINMCRNGGGLLVFPEGTRTKDGKIGAIKSGAFVVAGAAGVDMIPCRIIYGTEDGRLHLFCRVHVVFGKPIPAEQLIMGEKRDLKKLKAAKTALLESWQEMYDKYSFEQEKQ